ncbi:O-antigen ligase domain-containing protein [Thalassospira sp. MA62]|nr:O-antigen ligase domain-containing protein [Thalassospira sp. MA62]
MKTAHVTSLTMPLPTIPQRDGMGIWGILFGSFVMVVSLWLIAAGGMVAKLILVAFWTALLIKDAGRVRLGDVHVVAVMVLTALMCIVLLGSGNWTEKLRLIGNLVVLPLGLVAGCLIGRDCLKIMIPALMIYLMLSSAFYVTHEGLRLNHPFLFLGFFALCSVSGGRAAVALGGLSGIGVLFSQTRIAVIAMIINLIGAVRFTRAWTWLMGAIGLGLVGWLGHQMLPRLLMTHDSGRLVFWADFYDRWWAASDTQKWLGFGAGSVERILSTYPSFASFGALHNDHFRILFETGLIGAVLWGMGWIMMVWLVRGSRLSVCILASVMVTMVTDNTLSYGHYLMACGMAAGIAMGEHPKHG